MTSSPAILWINGPFGVGKTHTAHALHARVPGSFLFDPEELGFTLRRLTPPGRQEPDFQQHPLWVPFVLEALAEAASRADGPVIVPMTVTDVERHEALLKGLRERGLTAHHFTLLAPPAVIHARLRRRLEGRHSWAGAQVEDRLRELAGPRFAVHLNTYGRTVDAVAEEIGARAGLDLSPSSEPRFRRWWRVTWAHRR
ncbi:tunicamycin resistance protein [Deinococcus carri]|uniref:Tunicamycin resistance protein n=1 Tax=Deinococcus carri TaxID=1211323 RepID=A0ABP9W3F5_9DEIO